MDSRSLNRWKNRWRTDKFLLKGMAWMQPLDQEIFNNCTGCKKGEGRLSVLYFTAFLPPSCPLCALFFFFWPYSDCSWRTESWTFALIIWLFLQLKTTKETSYTAVLGTSFALQPTSNEKYTEMKRIRSQVPPNTLKMCVIKCLCSLFSLLKFWHQKAEFGNEFVSPYVSSHVFHFLCSVLQSGCPIVH